MTTQFPTALDTLTNPGENDTLDSATVPHADQHANANDAIEALQAKVGVNNSAVPTSLDYRVGVLEAGKEDAGTAAAAISAHAGGTGVHSIAGITGLQTALDAKIPSTEKGAALGVATLGADSKIPVAQLPAAVLGALSYQGTWNATTNSPTIPAASSDNRGYYYKVATAGSTNVDGITDWAVGDWIVSNGTAWDKVDNTELVSSVNGLAGAVVLGTDNIAEGGSNLYYTAARVRDTLLTGLSLAATTVVAATHTVLEAIGFLQAQITAYKDATITFTTKTFDLTDNTLTGTLAEFNTACSDADFADKATLIGKVYLGTWPASAMKPATTNGATAAAWDESGTNKQGDDYLAFSASSDQYAWFKFITPEGLDESAGFTAKFIWKEAAGATAHNVVWQIEMAARGDGDSLDVAWGTAQTVQDTGTNNTTGRISAATGTITPGGSWTAGDLMKVRVSRKASDTTNDTMDVLAHLEAVVLCATNTTLVEP